MNTAQYHLYTQLHVQERLSLILLVFTPKSTYCSQLLKLRIVPVVLNVRNIQEFFHVYFHMTLDILHTNYNTIKNPGNQKLPGIFFALFLEKKAIFGF